MCNSKNANTGQIIDLNSSGQRHSITFNPEWHHSGNRHWPSIGTPEEFKSIICPVLAFFELHMERSGDLMHRVGELDSLSTDGLFGCGVSIMSNRRTEPSEQEQNP